MVSSAPVLQIGDRMVGPGEPVYVIAELSANHRHDLDVARRLVEAAKAAGADAVKLQTYTADTLTIDCDNEYFRISGTIWEGRTLHELYREAYTPWEWHEELFALARKLGMHCFSTPFDETAVDFLETLDPPAYKIASFEAIDIPLIRLVARTGRPIIMSTGMADLGEIEEAVAAVRQEGNDQLALLHCTSAYPAPPDDMSLRTIPHLGATFRVPSGLSDHTLGVAVPVAAVSVGAVIVEKHLTLSRSDGGPDAAFSLEPAEFRTMVDALRTASAALGDVRYGATPREEQSRVLRRSLFIVRDLEAGGLLTPEHVRSIRPGHGLHPRYLPEVIGRRARHDLVRGTPLSWNMLAE